jgi:hypothetical protein
VQSSLFSGTPRNASVRATTLVTLRVLNKVRLARARAFLRACVLRVCVCMRARACVCV